MTRILLWLLALVGTAAGQMPDLVLDTALLHDTVGFDVQSFAPDACELQPIDLCVGGPGPRTLLRFSVFAVNRGTADLVLGVPPNIEPPNAGSFVFSACHDHFHFDSFARYELRQPGTTTVVTRGQKRSFCVEDTRQADASAGVTQKYCCSAACGSRQGVQIGWGDLYPSNLPCQWIDVTDTPPGDYELCVLLNTQGLLFEDPAGDEGCVPVTISAPSTSPPKVKVRAPRARARLRVGRRMAVAWKRRSHGEVLFQDVWYSHDGGATYTRLGHLTTKRPRFRTTITADMASEQARVKVYACVRNPADDLGAGALQCGASESGVFRVVP